MATGGVPYYLAQIRSGLSASQNIDHLAFSLQGTLFQDFDILFSSLFDDANDYVQIVKTVAKYQYGILQESLLRECGIPSGGYAVDKLKDLEQAGFLLSFRSCDNKRKGVFYRLIDEYSNFYLKWIDPLKASIQQNVTMSWEQMRASQSWKSWAGYHFETICFKHINQIKTALQLDNSTLVKTWSSRGSKTEKGAQIDLLFDRNDDAITICEIKYTDQPFKIDKSYYQSLQDKINVFRKATKTKKQIFLTFIASSGLKNSIYTEDGIASVVQLDDLFM